MGYFNYPHSCEFEHKKTHLRFPRPRRRPRISYDTEGAYEEHHLAQVAIRYFSRDSDQMDSRQVRALHQIHSRPQRLALVRALEARDLQKTISTRTVKKLLKLFSELFFFGSLMRIKLRWRHDFVESDDEEQNLLAWTSIKKTSNGQRYHDIEMNPRALSKSRLELKQLRMSMAADRIGTMLHELIHCFLFQYACEHCEVYKRYEGDHGRGFQLIAKAIEEQAPRLLGFAVDLGRLDSIKADMAPNEWEQPTLGASAHDMEVYGFLKPLQRRGMGSLGRHRTVRWTDEIFDDSSSGSNSPAPRRKRRKVGDEGGDGSNEGAEGGREEGTPMEVDD